MVNRNHPIIVVDDDPDFCDIYRQIIKKKGYRVICFSNTEHALEKMTEEKPMLVITDLMMSSLDSGFSFAQKIKGNSRFKDVPVIIVTAIGEKRGMDFTPRSKEDLDAMYADAFFAKPISPDMLIAKIEELVCKNIEEDLS
ncbi:MAG: response regulator [Spirochaetota bacterium]|nr:MAG: response regulator [Spirochaetota bacterium]